MEHPVMITKLHPEPEFNLGDLVRFRGSDLKMVAIHDYEFTVICEWISEDGEPFRYNFDRNMLVLIEKNKKHVSQ